MDMNASGCSNKAIVAFSLLLALAACGKTEQGTAKPLSVTAAEAERGERLRSEGDAKNLAFCLATLQAERQRNSTEDQVRAEQLQQQIKLLTPRVDAVKASSEGLALAFNSEFESLSKKLDSADMCGSLKCKDPLFRQTVMVASCPK